MNNGRNVTIDILKLVASLIIMAQHLYNVGVPGEYHFYDSWIYVELFLIITGFYTAKHFDKEVVGDKMKASVEYTISKFKPLFPYSSIVIAAAWTSYILILTTGENRKPITTIFSYLGRIITEFFYISPDPIVAPIWYLTILFLVFPVFCRVVQIENRYTLLTAGFLFPVVFYFLFGFGSDALSVRFLRVFAGLMLGTMVYEFNIVFSDWLEHKNKQQLKLLAIVTLMFPVISTFFCMRTYSTDLICFAVSLALILSKEQILPPIIMRKDFHIGDIGMFLFIVHWYVGTVVGIFGEKFDICAPLRVILYYLISIAAALVMTRIKISKEKRPGCAGKSGDLQC